MLSSIINKVNLPHRLGGVIGIAVLFICISPVMAEEHPSPPTTDHRPLITEDSDTILLTAQEIRAMQALKIADVLNNVPGIKAGDSSVSIHGSYKVKVFVDGRPINDPTSNHGAINWDLVSPDDVARIEVLRGKGGLMYGQDAGGGVILITMRNGNRMSGNIKAYTGNQDTRNISTALNTSSGKFGFGASAGYETTDGYQRNNDKERFQGGLKLNLSPGETTSYVLSMDYLQDERGLSGQPDHPTPHSRKETRNTAYAFQADAGKWISKTHYNEGRRHNTDDSKGLDKTLRVGKFGQDLAATFKTTDRGDLNCGASFGWDRAAGTGFDDQEAFSVSLFAAQSLTWEKWNTTFTAGMRGSQHTTFEDSVNPEVKLVYKKPVWRITAAYSRTNNTPSFYQRYNETSSTRPNPDLDMEQADNYSLSYFATPHKAFTFSLTGFYNLLTDRITYVTGNDGTGQYRNFGDVLYTGGDAAFSLKLHPTLKIKGAYTYLDVKDQETGLWLPCKSRHAVNLTLYWQPLRPLNVVAVGKYASEVYRDTKNTKTVDAYTIADLRADYAFKRFSVFGEVRNVFDKTYYYADGLLAPPRTWVVGVNWKI